MTLQALVIIRNLPQVLARKNLVRGSLLCSHCHGCTSQP
jgi:hypothetical protein